MQEYIHVVESQMRILNHKDSRVIISQPEGVNQINVPGQVIHYKNRFIGDSKSIPVSYVKPVAKKDQPEIEELIRETDLEGTIFFWDESDNKAIQSLDRQLAKTKVADGHNVLRNVYKQLAVSHKGKQCNGEYRTFMESATTGEKFDFGNHFSMLAEFYGLDESYVKKLDSQKIF